MLYYSRHYRIRAGCEQPPYASLLGGPRGDLGYLGYAVFLGDNDTFCLCAMVDPSDRDFADCLCQHDAFERVAAVLPGMPDWVDPDRVEPITPVLPMGQLRNTLHRSGDAPRATTGLVSIGDARCHTNPTFAFGMSLSLHHAVVLAEVADQAADPVDLVRTFTAAVEPDAVARFAAVSAEDAARARLWGGDPIDVTDRDAALPLFLRAVVYRVAVQDPDLLRAVTRRINALDPPDWLENQPDLLDRASKLYAEMAASGSIAPPPPREQMLQRLG